MSGISEVYDLTTIDTIRELQELVHDDRLKDEDPQLLTAVAETLDEHKIESYLIPSGTPGEEGGEPGPAQSRSSSITRSLSTNTEVTAQMERTRAGKPLRWVRRFVRGSETTPTTVTLFG